MRNEMGTALTSPIGKVPSDVLLRSVLPYLGAKRQEILVGPRHGADAGVIDLGSDQVLTITTDPFFVMPDLGWERAAWFAVHIVASDAATTGIAPSYISIDLNLPAEMPDSDLASLWESVHLACSGLGVAVVTGHTGRYDGCAFPMVGGATALGVGSSDRYISPAMTRPGDVLLMTKGAAIETTGMFGAVLPEYLAASLGFEVAAEADEMFASMTVVPDAMAAVAAGVRDEGVTYLHDATERGVFGGIVEMAEAAGSGLLVDRNAIPILRATRAVCDLFEIDPYTASSEGTLLIACRASKMTAILASLDAAGIAAARIGEFTPADEGIRIVTDGREQPLLTPREDPFWPSFAAAVRATAP